MPQRLLRVGSGAGGLHAGVSLSENETTGRPSDRVGPVSLWLPASSSDQFIACGSTPPRMVRLLRLLACRLRSPRFPSPDYLRWQSQPQRVGLVKPRRVSCGRCRIVLRRCAAADRSVRTSGDRPARLDHRPLQLPLHLLHAGRGHEVAAPRGAPHLRGAGSESSGCAWSATASTRSGSPAGSPRFEPIFHASSRCSPPSGSTSR